MRPLLLTTILFSIFTFHNTVYAQEYLPDKEGVASALTKKQFSPYAGREFPTQVMWGDTHLHTAISVDAGTMNTLGQEEALRFARGDEVTTTHGLRAKLSRPLDFLVVSDHAEMYGLMPQLLERQSQRSCPRKQVSAGTTCSMAVTVIRSLKPRWISSRR